MTVSENEPAAAGDAAANPDDSRLGLAGSVPVFAPPLQGWLAIADIVADSDQDVAGLMVMGERVVRAALEAELPSLVSDIGDVLGLSDIGLDEVAQTLSAGALPFTSETLALQMSDAYDDVLQGFANSEPDDPQPMAFVDKIIKAFVNSPPVAERNGGAQYSKMQEQVSQAVSAGAVPRWTAICSLEQPDVLGGRVPIYCARRGHRWVSGGTHLGAHELTYTGSAESSFEGRVRNDMNFVGQLGEGGGYRVSLSEQSPSPFYGVIGRDAMGLDTGLSGWGYALHLVEGPEARILTKMPRVLRRQRHKLEDHVGALIKRSEQRVHNALAAAHIPLTLVHPLLGLITAAANAIIGFIVDFLAKAWSEVDLSTWTVWHTALIGTDQVPISVFTLGGRDAGSPKLRRLVGRETDGTPITDDRYEGDDHNPEHALYARFLIGCSSPGSDLFDEKLLIAVARFGRPLAWQEPLETGSGLRVLVPHLDRPMDATDRTGRAARARSGDEGVAGLSKVMYVSAIRADVRMAQANYLGVGRPAVKRRASGTVRSFQL